MDRMQILKSVHRALSCKVEKAESPAGYDVDQKIWDFFVQNKPPFKDVVVHDLAGQLGLEPDDVEERIYNLLGSIVSGGKSNGIRPAALTDETLKVGMGVEAEHTDSPLLQQKIVYDHVAELGDEYYKNLLEMEDKMKSGNG